MIQSVRSVLSVYGSWTGVTVVFSATFLFHSVMCTEAAIWDKKNTKQKGVKICDMHLLVKNDLPGRHYHHLPNKM